MSHAGEVLKSSDEMVVCLGTRESGIIDYRLGTKVSLTYRGHGRILCHSCVRVNGCEHAERIRRYREEHSL